MRDFKVLKFLDRFKHLFEKSGINYEVMRKILQMKLIMDGRRTLTIMNNSNKKQDDDNGFFKSLWVYTLLGLIVMILVIPDKSFMFQMSFAFGIMMFMIMTSLISDFSSILIDVQDKNILFSKPVDSKTINAAKFLHIFIYMFYITMAMMAPSLIASLIRHGIGFFMLFLFEIILMDLFIIVLTALLYFLILRFFDGEKLKDIINYVQIILSIAITVGYQLIGRLFNVMDINMTFIPKWWQYFIVPIWFAAPFEMIFKGSSNNYLIIFSILAIVVPIISIFVYSKSMSAFEKNLQKLNNNGTRNNKNKITLNQKLSKMICPDKEERAFFNFSCNMLKNEREFKLKVYPSLGFAIIFPFIFMFNEMRDMHSFSQWITDMRSTKYYLNIYFCALFLPMVVMMIKYSGKYKGAWIYKTMPINRLSSVFKGAFKAFIVRLILPIYIFECIIFMLIFGLSIFPHLIVVFLNMILFSIISFKITKKGLPFSISFQVTQQSEGLMMIPLMILLGIIAGIHYVLTKVSYAVYIYMIIMLLLDILLWKKAFNIKWESLQD